MIEIFRLELVQVKQNSKFSSRRLFVNQSRRNTELNSKPVRLLATTPHHKKNCVTSAWRSGSVGLYSIWESTGLAYIRVFSFFVLFSHQRYIIITVVFIYFCLHVTHIILLRRRKVNHYLMLMSIYELFAYGQLDVSPIGTKT